MHWLPDPSPAAITAALRIVAPAIAGGPLAPPTLHGGDDPLWHAGSVLVDNRYVAKFAWSRVAAERVSQETAVLTALAGLPHIPEVVAASSDPVLLITRRVAGTSLFTAMDGLDPDDAGRQLAGFLAVLHDATTRARVEAALAPLPPADQRPGHPASTETLRAGLPRHLGPVQWTTVARWCDWADATLAEPRPTVLVHADLHGDNQVWHGGRLQVVVDFESASAAEPEYDLRAFPGTGAGLPLLLATATHYEALTGHRHALDRVMAWHLRTALTDILWRTEAGVPLPDHRTIPEWLTDLTDRFTALGFTPGTPVGF